MNKYLVFGGKKIGGGFCLGGWFDFQGEFTHLSDAVYFIQGRNLAWAHIVCPLLDTVLKYEPLIRDPYGQQGKTT